jgi:adenosyl cobinamide kinase/adenosyl cobinamide phosphate guanylyltransferase
VPLTHTSVSAVPGLPAGRIVIAGGPGSGKSTLLQALAAQWQESTRRRASYVPGKRHGLRFTESDEAIATAWSVQLSEFKAASWPTVIVSNELGWSLVPTELQARRFRDLAGTLAQLTSAAADDVWLMIAGCPLRLK